MTTLPRIDFPSADVLHRSDLLALGVTHGEILRLSRTGHLRPLGRGAYVRDELAASRSADELFRLRALAAGQRSPSLVVSHQSAAAVHGLPLWPKPDRVHLTRVGKGGAIRNVARVVHCGQLAEDDWFEADGCRVTTVSRTLLDLARTTDLETVTVTADAALGRGLVGSTELDGVLRRARRSPGMPAARRALAFADGRSESPGESRLRVRLRRAGFPPPQLQIEVIDLAGRVLGRADLGYPDSGTVIEFDGAVKYRGLLRPGQRAEDALVAEKRREDRIRSTGTAVARFCWDELGNTALLVARIARAAALGEAALRTAGIAATFHPAAPVRYLGLEARSLRDRASPEAT